MMRRAGLGFARSFSSAAKAAPGSKGKVLLLYSGGLDTSTILAWLKEQGYGVVAYCANLGHDEDYDAVIEKGLKVGAEEVIIDDLREDFLHNYIYPSIQANGIYENVYLMGTSLARPCISAGAMRAAKKHGCQFLSHGATGKGNDQVRFELSFYSLDPSIQCVIPWRDPAFFNRFQGRSDLLQYAKEQGIPVTQTKAKPYSMDENMFHISYEAGILEDPSQAPPDDMFRLTTDPKDAPDTPTNLTIDFEKGLPTRVVNHTSGFDSTDPLEMFLHLNKTGGENGVGRIDMVENRFVGIKSRGVYETPAGTILHNAHLDVESLTMDREVRRVRDGLTAKFAELCYNGFWFSPEMELILSTIKESQKHVTGTVNLELYKGNVTRKGRSSPLSLYDSKISSMDEAGGYNPENAAGFIKVNAHRLTSHYKRQQMIKKD